MINSISRRLQFSYGLLLFGMLVALGFTAFGMQRTNRLQVIDAGLQARSTQLTGTLFRQAQGVGRPGAGRSFLGGDGPGELRMAGRMASLFDEKGSAAHFYIVQEVKAEGRVLFRSKNAPSEVVLPENLEALPDAGLFRIRGEVRELIKLNRGGALILVGRDISTELAAVRLQAGQLVGAGALLLIGGLCISGWVTRRSLKPIAEISDAATRIAGGELDERIQTKDSRSELGELASVLNHTFDELSDAYNRQAQFTSDASHELRTPITVILSETQSTLKHPRTIDEYQESLNICMKTARSMRNLTDSLLALARFDAGEEDLARQESVDLAELVEHCIIGLEDTATQRGLQVTKKLEAVCCAGDPTRLEQVVNNLLNNAVAYNREGGSLCVSVAEVDGWALIEVADTGLGISSEDMPHVFDRFYRADKARATFAGHSGLGLAICKNIVEAHGGELTVKSVLGEGSTFSVKLPSV